MHPLLFRLFPPFLFSSLFASRNDERIWPCRNWTKRGIWGGERGGKGVVLVETKTGRRPLIESHICSGPVRALSPTLLPSSSTSLPSPFFPLLFSGARAFSPVFSPIREVRNRGREEETGWRVQESWPRTKIYVWKHAEEKAPRSFDVER